MKNNQESVHQIWEKFDNLEKKSLEDDSLGHTKMNVLAKPFYQSEKKREEKLNEKNLFMFNQ